MDVTAHPVATDLKLRAAREFRVKVREPGFLAREIWGVDQGLFDVMLGFRDNDRSHRYRRPGHTWF